jgi:hypothetical protein
MEQVPPTRDCEIDAAFVRTRPWMRRLEAKRGFGPEQRMEFEGTLYLWFQRFARRPGSVDRPVKAIRWSLIRTAYRAARELDGAGAEEGNA